MVCLSLKQESSGAQLNDMRSLAELHDISSKSKWHCGAVIEGHFSPNNENPGQLDQHSSTSPLEDHLPVESAHVDMTSLVLSVIVEPSNRIGRLLKHLSMSRIIAGITETYGGGLNMFNKRCLSLGWHHKLQPPF